MCLAVCTCIIARVLLCSKELFSQVCFTTISFNTNILPEFMNCLKLVA